MTKKQLKEYCKAEFENIDSVLSELFSVIKDKKSEYSIPELAAIATFIHNFYNGIEKLGSGGVLNSITPKLHNSGTQ